MVPQYVYPDNAVEFGNASCGSQNYELCQIIGPHGRMSENMCAYTRRVGSAEEAFGATSLQGWIMEWIIHDGYGSDLGCTMMGADM